MALVVPNSADLLMLNYILSSPSGGVKLRLFKNNLTPSKSTVIGDITECDEAGYLAKTLSYASWTIATVDGQNLAVYALQDFTFSEEATVYGFYGTTTSNQLLFIEKFPTAYTLAVDGGTIGIIPKLNLN